MFYIPGEPHGLPHDPLIACVVPRPIGWISTIDRNGNANLAPFSLFNLVRYDPPAVMFCANGPHLDGGPKDSARNAVETGEFVYNMATHAMRDPCNESSAFLDRGVDEFGHAGLTKLPSRLVRPPRVAGSPVQFECRTVLQVSLPGGPSNAVIFGSVVGVHIADDALTDGLLDYDRILPLARMGYLDFAVSRPAFPMPRIGSART
ncbi:flavin reductase family protein [Marinibaculum pumilum]|uniref:Flavin reductase family protein n=1 Tax=Marinibaculum pumilum TaxID=1766165 RepID=A0ABV7L5P0_9PROT